MTIFKKLAMAIALFVTMTGYAVAIPVCNNDGRCVDSSPNIVGKVTNRAVRYVNDVATQYLPHPPGCPRRAFCGCGASIEVFGKSRRDLWLAANWLKFPRTAPAPGMAAARRGHVFVLKQHVSDNHWLAADYNSGGRKSRLHVRSIAGFTVVNPHG